MKYNQRHYHNLSRLHIIKYLFTKDCCFIIIIIKIHTYYRLQLIKKLCVGHVIQYSFVTLCVTRHR